MSLCAALHRLQQIIGIIKETAGRYYPDLVHPLPDGPDRDELDLQTQEHLADLRALLGPLKKAAADEGWPTKRVDWLCGVLDGHVARLLEWSSRLVSESVDEPDGTTWARLRRVDEKSWNGGDPRTTLATLCGEVDSALQCVMELSLDGDEDGVPRRATAVMEQPRTHGSALPRTTVATVGDLADECGVTTDAMDSALRRYAKTHRDCRVPLENPKPREPKYVFRRADIQPVLDKFKERRANRRPK
jgi:hypothetical protein